jgi:nucleotidyltransferase/DNA polymerase involved in DNA repair
MIGLYMKLTKEQVAHLYELAHNNFQDKCYECERLKQRMEKHLGERVVRRIKRLLKKYPYEK